MTTIGITGYLNKAKNFVKSKILSKSNPGDENMRGHADGFRRKLMSLQEGLAKRKKNI